MICGSLSCEVLTYFLPILQATFNDLPAVLAIWGGLCRLEDDKCDTHPQEAQEGGLVEWQVKLGWHQSRGKSWSRPSWAHHTAHTGQPGDQASQRGFRKGRPYLINLISFYDKVTHIGLKLQNLRFDKLWSSLCSAAIRRNRKMSYSTGKINKSWYFLNFLHVSTCHFSVTPLLFGVPSSFFFIALEYHHLPPVLLSLVEHQAARGLFRADLTACWLTNVLQQEW